LTTFTVRSLMHQPTLPLPGWNNPEGIMQISLYVAGAVGTSITAWYLYQIASRKTVRVRYKLRLVAVYLPVTFITLAILKSEGMTEAKAAVFSFLVGCGAAYLFTKPPKQTRRIPKAVRDAVIARDLTAKGLKWDPAKYHIDHKVPFSRGGDNSIRNLRVIEKHKNLSKGNKMPGAREFLS
jgi:uncharacterized membrane protein YfcA